VASHDDKSQGGQGSRPGGVRSHQPGAGKQTLVEQIVAPVVQRRAVDQRDETTVHAAASRGVATPASPLPFSDTLQRVFGRHDVSSIRDITAKIDLASDAAASKSTRGPAGKGFDKSLGATASDLEALCKDLLDKNVAAEKGAE
jgi:hypothetical protein